MADRPRAAAWRVYRVLTESEPPYLTVETFVDEFDTSGAAIACAREWLGHRMLVREVKGKPCHCMQKLDMSGNVIARSRSKSCPVHGTKTKPPPTPRHY